MTSLSRSFNLARHRLSSSLSSAPLRVCLSFFLFGLINNVLYVIILSAALDLVGADLPKAIVLLADVIPSFFTKLTLPYVVHVVPYHLRIIVLIALSFAGMVLVAGAESLVIRLFGVGLASVSSGAGELSFLGLTHFYGPWSLASWSSGTGAAGLVGAGLYLFCTTIMKWSVRSSLLAMSLLPAFMALSFFAILPRGVLSKNKRTTYNDYTAIAGEAEDDVEQSSTSQCDAAGNTDELTTSVIDHLLGAGSASQEIEGQRAIVMTVSASRGSRLAATWNSLVQNLQRSEHLFFPYMLPLLLVYIAEYTINQGVAPTLLYPLEQTPFTEYRDFYPTYSTIYQVGVFISRSSAPFIRFKRLYLLSWLQCVNLAILISASYVSWIPTVWIVFGIIFWEGLLGGSVYVNTFYEITDNVPVEEREFSLAATTVSDSGGICVAGIISLFLEPFLCRSQVARGMNYCKMT